MRFKWIKWNREHVAEHGVTPREAEQVVTSDESWHSTRKDGTVVTIGSTAAGRRLLVVWRENENEMPDIFADLDPMIFVITAYDV